MTSMPRPTITVIMATYNCADTVDAALDSVLQQTYPHWDLVVCDDASTDGTWDLLNAATDRFGERLTLLRNDANRKLAFSLNRCLQVATGELVARMDGDDISEPERFDRQVRFLLENPDVDLVGTAMRRFDSRGEIGVLQAPSQNPDKWTIARDGKVPFFHATIVARRSVFDRVGGYTDVWRTVRCEDADLWFKFMHAGFTGRNIPDALYSVREDEQAIRRRTAISRWATYLTMIHGYRLLRSPLKPYLISTIGLLKALVPHRVMVWRHDLLSRRLRDGQTSEGLSGT